MATETLSRIPARVSVLQFAAAGALASFAVFVLCWAGAALALIPATHAYIALFTAAPVASTTALAEGALWAALFGALTAAIVAISLNVFSFLGRR